MAHTSASISQADIARMSSHQSQHAPHEERIPSGIVGARIRQLQTLNAPENGVAKSQELDITAERERENTRLG